MTDESAAQITFPRIQERLRLEIAVIALLLGLVYFFACSLVVLAVLWVIALFDEKVQAAGVLNMLAAGAPYILAASVVLTFIHWMVIRSRGIYKTLKLMGAEPPDGGDSYHRRFINIVAEFEAASGLSGVEAYVVGEKYLNAFSLDDGQGRRAVAATEGLISSLTRSQLQGVMAHEFAHLARRDSMIATVAVTMMGTMALALKSMTSGKLLEGGIRAAFEDLRIAPFVILLWIAVTAALLLSRAATGLVYLALSRKTEEMADATAVEILRDPFGLAQALAVIGRNDGLDFRGHRPMGPLYFAGAAAEGSLFDTHPPIRQRMLTLLRLAKKPPSEVYRIIRKRRRRSLRHIKLDRDGLPSLWTGIGEEDGAVPARPYNGKGVCPRCGEPLIAEAYEGVTIKACPRCDGKLVGTKELRKILIRQEYEFDGKLKNLATRHRELAWEKTKGMGRAEAVDASAPIVCPSCSRGLSRAFQSYHSMVPVDHCRYCNLTWFDANELEILQILTEEIREATQDAGSRKA